MRLVLAAIVVPLVLVTLVGLVVLWPKHSTLVGSQPFTSQEASLETATITSLDVAQCQEASAALGGVSDGSLLKDAVCAKITSGAGAGLILPVHIPAESRPAAGVGSS